MNGNRAEEDGESRTAKDRTGETAAGAKPHGTDAEERHPRGTEESPLPGGQRHGRAAAAERDHPAQVDERGEEEAAEQQREHQEGEREQSSQGPTHHRQGHRGRGQRSSRGRSQGGAHHQRRPGPLRDHARSHGSIEDEIEPLDHKIEPTPLPGTPNILARDEHTVSRKLIDDDCLKVMRRLIHHGYKAFLVGGAVRDLLLGKSPKDYDVGTDASPETVRALFRNSRIIGRRFRINHVYFRGNKIIEVSTFRASSMPDMPTEGQMLASDNTYGDPETDAVRRDLTINGLFYDLSSFSVIDYVGGIADLRQGVIRTIGDPNTRFPEDPVRMIRAVRHAARAGFTIADETYEAILRHRESITLAAPARVYEEVLRELRGGASVRSFRLLDDTGLLQYLLPVLAEAIAEDRATVWHHLEHALLEIDKASRERTEELSASVLMPAVLIGNLPLRYVEELSADPRQRELVEYWKISPDSTDGIAPELPSEEESEERREVRPFRRARRRTGSSRLGKLVSNLFEKVGVSRKERERMEQLLVARMNMLLSEDENLADQLLGRSYFQDALLLLRCTAHDPRSRERLEYWEQLAAEGERPKRRRRGGRRRGRGRRGTRPQP